MIRVVKSSSPPAPLLTRGVRDRARLIDLEEQDPAACQAPDNTILTPKDGIYNDPRVKRQVRADQHNKCCYCEAKPSDNYGDVEHYRPKGGVQQTRSDELEKPGYYWLAHEWSNLYFACIFCNQKYKGNYFPLRHAEARARSHADVLTLEQPWLLDPAEDPVPHLTFVKDAIKPLTDRGRYTIAICGLDRPELIQRRIQHLRCKLPPKVSQLKVERSNNFSLSIFLAVHEKKSIQRSPGSGHFAPTGPRPDRGADLPRA